MESSRVISQFFAEEIPISIKFLDIIDGLNNSLEQLQLPSEIQCIYNPTIYARHTFEMYVQKYCNTKKEIMYFGMNPGPWGMSQTGVPFGEISSVRDWLRIEGPVGKPPYEIPSRPVKGFDKMVEYMQQAIKLAEEALAAQEVPVGCVFIVDGTVVAEGRNSVNGTRNPTRHAEFNCIDQVLQHCKTINIDYQDYCKKISVYVTVEPCIMCAAALNNLSVKEVVYGCANDRFGGKTVLDVSQFYERSYEVTGNLLADEAMALLKRFYKGENPNAPESKVKKKLPCE